MLQSPWRTTLLATLFACVALACGEPARQDAGAAKASAPAAPAADQPPPGTPPHAKWDIVKLLREDAAAKRSPSDGGGRAWLAPGPENPTQVPVASSRRFELVYEVGPLGIATHGAIYLQVSPFWGWSTPQVEETDAPGYTEFKASASDIELDAKTLGPQLLVIEVVGRPLVAGERLNLVYGAGTPGATTDRFAEHASRFWFAVDGDGDGVRAIVPDSPTVDVLAGPPAQLRVTLPSVARPGERVPVTLALLDAAGNMGTPTAGPIVFPDPPAGLELPARVALTPADHGRMTIYALARTPGNVRLRAEGPQGLAGESNPLQISRDGPRVLWGDLHGHSNFSDGTGTPEDYYLYARDVAGLDVAALTDHDHWGIQALDSHPELWDEIQRQTKRFHEPGRFVTLLGFEWTSWIQGHRHVLRFDDQGKVLSSLDPAYESPLQLWAALAGQPALTFAHHSAGGPVPTNWLIPPDPVLEPITEIVSVHGSSEAADSPQPIYDAVPGNFVRDGALGRGYRFGFIGSGDSHDGHPGLAQLTSPDGGNPLRRPHARRRARGAARAARVCDERPADPAALRARRAPDGREREAGSGREPQRSAVRVGRLAEPARTRRSDPQRPRGRFHRPGWGTRGDARAPRLGAAPGRVRLRARGAARRRRGVVEPDLRRMTGSGAAVDESLISVLLPVWNAADTLPACLASLQRQTEASWECVLVDDGSSDASLAIAREHAARDARFEVLALPHRGLVCALNAGLARCRGRFIARMDADDWMHRERLAVQAAALDASPALAAVGCHTRLFPSAALGPGMRAYARWLASIDSPERVREEAFVECPIPHPTLMLRAELLRELAYRDLGWPEDYDLLLRLLERGESIGVVAKRLLGWRHAPGRLSQTGAAYTPARFVACKAGFLARGFLAGGERYALWGYGGTGRALARALRAHAKHPSLIVELHPRRIGKRIQGARVISPDALERGLGLPLVVSVAGATARAEIRAALAKLGFLETRDFVCAA